MSKGVVSIGVKAPIIRKGDNLRYIVVDSVLSTVDIQDKDVIGITESIVARAQGNYVTIDDIAAFMEHKKYSKKIVLFNPLMSRNRFSLILKGIARYADDIVIYLNGKSDDQGNPNYGVNMFTGINIQDYYNEICNWENCRLVFKDIEELNENGLEIKEGYDFIDCSCRPNNKFYAHTLKDIMNEPITLDGYVYSGYNKEWGVLGSNKADEELLKLFPDPEQSKKLIEEIQKEIMFRTGKHVEVMIYGDGCFKDPVGGIWEFADPVTSPAYTEGLEGLPNEIKIKYFADSKYKNLKGEELEKAIDEEIEANKEKQLVGSMASQGTTPRRYVDLLASLMDLTTGSGSRKTPIVVVQNYFE